MMKPHQAMRALALTLLVFALAACQANTAGSQLVLSNKSAVELRAIQVRAFDTADNAKVLRAAIATLQDIGYTIEKVEPAAGTVTGTKLAILRLTVAISPRGQTQTAVRANAQVKLAPTVTSENQVDDPEFYQKLFFEPLAKALFLTALQVEDAQATPN